MLSEQELTNKPLWESMFPSHATSILQGRKVKNSVDVIAALCLHGPTTTREIAKFVLSNTKDYHYKPIRDKDARIREQMYYKILQGRYRKKSGQKRSSERYPGLISEGYVTKTGSKLNEVNKNVNLYFTTLQGCLFALSIKFGNEETLKFIHNAARYHLFFAFLKMLLDKGANLSFVRQIFVESLQEKLIKNGKLTFNEDITFYFTKISELCGFALLQKIKNVNKINADEILNAPPRHRPKVKRFEEHPVGKQIVVISEVYSKLYNKKPDEKWSQKIKNFFDVEIEDEDELWKESRLLWLVLRELNAALIYI